MFKIKVHINPLNADLNSICHLLALLGARPILYISRIRVNPSSSNFLSLRSKYSSKHPIITHSEMYSSLKVLHGKREVSALRGNIIRVYKP
jgi:hypothetical protein